MIVIIIIVALLVVFTLKGFIDQKREIKKLRQSVMREFGSFCEKDISPARAAAIGYYNDHREHSELYVDDITWHDMELDRIYELINSCRTAIGEEYLYYALRNPENNPDRLSKREELINYLIEDEEVRTNLGIRLSYVGNLKNISAYEYMMRLKNCSTDSSMKHIVQCILMLASIGVCFVNPAIGIFLAVGMFFVNVITYFKRKTQIEAYFSIVGYIIRLLESSDKLETSNSGLLNEYFNNIHESVRSLNKLKINSEIVLNPSMNGDILQSLMDYLRMALHIDLIKFNSMLKFFSGKQKEFEILFENIGYLDFAWAAASFRVYMKDRSCVPSLKCKDDCKEGYRIEAEDIAHPLIEAAVKNSCCINCASLVTGSNASGKSTFLRTLGINMILATTVHTVCAKTFTANIMRVMSSIAISDDLSSGESYYMVEIRSLKRIVDAMQESVPVLAFIDEVLRGTNTIERIAASSRILLSMSKGNGICMAATHDIELTYILDRYFKNYHFEEQVEDDDITFDYRLKDGRATSRNAIRLLKLMGYSEDIIESASKMANEYLETNEWRLQEEHA